LKTSIKRVANMERMVTHKKAQLVDLPAKGDEVDKMPVQVENTVLKDQDAYLFEFPTNLTPMQKLHQIVEDEYLMSSLNNDLREYAVHGNPTTRVFGTKYADFLAYKESGYTGCDIVNGYMHLLEETYNNGGKNRFFPHQFFINVMNKATFERVVSKRDFKKGWAKWEKLFFPIQHNNHWFLIVADKVKEEILVYDSLPHNNKHHFYGVKKLIDRMKTKKGNWIVDTQQ
jgi:hypothetical protein